MALSGLHLFDLLIFFLCLRQSCWKVGIVAVDDSDIRRYAYSIWPVVSFLPWFRRFDGDLVVIAMINRMMANHSCLRSHLGRIGDNRQYEKIDHVY
jgi:hypothetical protein